jgi:hypothetical protein
VAAGIGVDELVAPDPRDHPASRRVDSAGSLPAAAAR